MPLDPASRHGRASSTGSADAFPSTSSRPEDNAARTAAFEGATTGRRASVAEPNRSGTQGGPGHQRGSADNPSQERSAVNPQRHAPLPAPTVHHLLLQQSRLNPAYSPYNPDAAGLLGGRRGQNRRAVADWIRNHLPRRHRTVDAPSHQQPEIAAQLSGEQAHIAEIRTRAGHLQRRVLDVVSHDVDVSIEDDFAGHTPGISIGNLHVFSYSEETLDHLHFISQVLQQIDEDLSSGKFPSEVVQTIFDTQDWGKVSIGISEDVFEEDANHVVHEHSGDVLAFQPYTELSPHQITGALEGLVSQRRSILEIAASIRDFCRRFQILTGESISLPDVKAAALYSYINGIKIGALKIYSDEGSPSQRLDFVSKILQQLHDYLSDRELHRKISYALISTLDEPRLCIVNSWVSPEQSTRYKTHYLSGVHAVHIDPTMELAPPLIKEALSALVVQTEEFAEIKERARHIRSKIQFLVEQTINVDTNLLDTEQCCVNIGNVKIHPTSAHSEEKRRFVLRLVRQLDDDLSTHQIRPEVASAVFSGGRPVKLDLRNSESLVLPSQRDRYSFAQSNNDFISILFPSSDLAPLQVSDLFTTLKQISVLKNRVEGLVDLCESRTRSVVVKSIRVGVDHHDVRIGTFFVTTSLLHDPDHSRIDFLIEVLTQIEVDARQLRISTDMLRNIFSNPSDLPLEITASSESPEHFYDSHTSRGRGNRVVIGSNGQLEAHQISRILTNSISYSHPPAEATPIQDPELPEHDRNPLRRISHLTSKINEIVPDLMELDSNQDKVNLTIGVVTVARATDLDLTTNALHIYHPDSTPEYNLGPMLRFLRTLDAMVSEFSGFRQSLESLNELNAGIINLSPNGSGTRFDRGEAVPIVDITDDAPLMRPDNSSFPDVPEWVGADYYRVNVYNAIMFLNEHVDGNRPDPMA